MECRENFLLTEPAAEILDWLEISDLGRLGLTCTFFQPQLPIARAAHFIVIEQHSVALKKMLDDFNSELLQKILSQKVAKAITKSGQTIINRTLLQLAFIKGDVECISVLKSYMDKEEIAKQINEIILIVSPTIRYFIERINGNTDISLRNDAIKYVSEPGFQSKNPADSYFVTYKTKIADIEEFKYGNIPRSISMSVSNIKRDVERLFQECKTGLIPSPNK